MKPLRGIESLVRERPWLSRGMLVVCSLSLLATSPEYDPSDSYAPLTKRVYAPPCALTADAPACEFLVTLTHDAAEGPFVTERATANVHGAVAAEGVTGDQPFVLVHVASDDPPVPNDLSVLTEFSAVRSLEFTGDCDAAAGGGACVSTFTVSFQRSDLGERGGTIHVSWELSLEANAPHGADAGGGELPWTVRYTER